MVQRSPVNIKVYFGFYMIAAAFLLLVPLQLTIAWLIAVLVHELSHFIALKFCGVTVYRICIGISGVQMVTEAMTKRQELICALAGPIGGLCLLPAARWIPCTAICALAHSVYNLLPIFPLDGGRALKCIAHKLLGEQMGTHICRLFDYIFITLLFISTVVISFRFHLGILLPSLPVLIFVKIKLANRRNK